MLFLGHLVIGLIAGFILYELFHDKNMIIFCAIGSVLPDIVDKPMGYIILNSVLDYGRIYFHSLVIFTLFLVTGIIVWRYYHSTSFLCVGLGIIIHQVVDLMWYQPVNWYYPFLGPYQAHTPKDYFSRAVVSELTSTTEWIFLIAVTIIIVTAMIRVYRQEPLVTPDPLREQQQRNLYTGLLGLALFVLLLSVAIIVIWQPYQEMIF